MKVFFCILIVLCSAATITFAQTEQGRMGVYGGLSMGTFINSNSGDPSFSLNLYPSFLYFVADNLALSPGVGFQYYSYTTGHNLTVSVSGDVQYYFGSSSLKPYVEVGASYSTTKFNTMTREALNSTSLNAGIGLAYFINNSVSVNGLLQYEEFGNSSPYTNANRSALIFLVGMSYILPK